MVSIISYSCWKKKKVCKYVFMWVLCSNYDEKGYTEVK